MEKMHARMLAGVGEWRRRRRKWGEEEQLMGGTRDKGGEEEERNDSVLMHRAVSLCLSVRITKSHHASAEERIRNLGF